MAPWLVIVAGPNGAGKSTFVSSGAIHRIATTPENPSFEILNPDAAARRIAGAASMTPEINLQAAVTVEAVLKQAIQVGESIGIETVLSTDKYRPVVLDALRAGYRVMLHYIVLADPDLHIGRVAQRVVQGGHDVEKSKIAERYFRSLAQLPWFASNASVAFIWDNSKIGGTASGPQLLAEKTFDGGWSRFAEANPLHAEIHEAINRAIAGKF